MKSNKKVLIAEDELLIAKVLRMQLEKHGFEVENVIDAESAFNVVKHMQPDVIILDVYLKNNSTGIDAALKIREIGINAPIIFTTGNSYNDTIKLVKDISFCSVLNKPVDFDTLLNLINLEAVS
jgi:DNA-binding response OmpR family regulator